VGIVTVSKDVSGMITVSFPYDPQLVEKVKTIDSRKWHKDEKYWSFTDSEETLEKILKVFEGEEIHIDPVLQTKPPIPVIAREEVLKQSTKNSFPTLEKGGKGGFEDLRRELVSRKYSYKTVKGYLYYNRDFVSFIGKDPSGITE